MHTTGKTFSLFSKTKRTEWFLFENSGSATNTLFGIYLWHYVFLLWCHVLVFTWERFFLPFHYSEYILLTQPHWIPAHMPDCSSLSYHCVRNVKGLLLSSENRAASIISGQVLFFFFKEISIGDSGNVAKIEIQFPEYFCCEFLLEILKTKKRWGREISKEKGFNKLCVV